MGSQISRVGRICSALLLLLLGWLATPQSLHHSSSVGCVETEIHQQPLGHDNINIVREFLCWRFHA